MRKRAGAVALGAALVVSVLSVAPGSAGPTAAAGDTIAVVAVDYNFNGLPTRLDKGETKFTFRNSAERTHELVMFKRRNKSNKTFKELVQMSDKQVEKHVRFVGGTWAKAGKRGEPIKATMTTGRYFALCFISNGRNKPPHFTKGMLTKIDVK